MESKMIFRVSYVVLILSTAIWAHRHSNESEKSTEKPTRSMEHNYYWRDYRGQLPKDAICGAPKLYIAQVYFEGILPGTLYPKDREVCTEQEGFKRIVKSSIKVLCDKSKNNFEWEYVNIDWLTKQKLKDMVVGGYEDDKTLYIGRIFHEGNWRIGKVLPPPWKSKGLIVWQNNTRSYVAQDFMILKYLDEGKMDENKEA